MIMINPVHLEMITANVEALSDSALPCALTHFVINGRIATESDFGKGLDTGEGNSNYWGCTNRVFKSRPLRQYVLTKYDITEDDYYKICEFLEDYLSVGQCGLCD
jgi:predicted metal-binding transcription factor (methanogenesis marker protein 9)